MSVVVEVDGAQTANVLHFQQTTIGTPTLEQSYSDLDSLWDSVADSAWSTRTSEEARLSCIKIQKIRPLRPPAQIFSRNRLGAVTGVAMPSINSCVHSWYTALTTRRGRGRKFWSGLPKGHVQDNNIAVAGFATERDFALVFLNPWVGTETYDPGIFSYTGEVFNAAQGILVRPVIKNIRNRKPDLCV